MKLTNSNSAAAVSGRDVREIAAASGAPKDGVWKSVRRLKEDGAVPSRLKVRGR